jgi:hypothetical protein
LLSLNLCFGGPIIDSESGAIYIVAAIAR